MKFSTLALIASVGSVSAFSGSSYVVVSRLPVMNSVLFLKYRCRIVNPWFIILL